MKEYDNIINLSRHISKSRTPMPIIHRAAQFAPFAALTGHDAVIKETARVTEERIDLDIYMKEAINNKLQMLMCKIKEYPKIQIKYFKADERKAGGRYVNITGAAKKIDKYKKLIIMEDDRKIPIDEILELEILNQI